MSTPRNRAAAIPAVEPAVDPTPIEPTNAELMALIVELSARLDWLATALSVPPQPKK